MIKHYIWVLVLLLTACGLAVGDYNGGIVSTIPDKPTYCSVKRVDNKSVIQCPDGSSAEIKDGDNGFNGVSVIGPKGDAGNSGAQGAIGSTGASGINGINGHNSIIEIANTSSCPNQGYTLIAAVDLNDDGLIESTDSNLQSVQVCNGENGQTGAMGQAGVDGHDGTNTSITPFTPIAILDPCGNKPGVYDEVFLKLNNGTILASFSDNANGNNTRWSVLTAGNYISTDGSFCYFSVDASGSLYNEHY